MTTQKGTPLFFDWAKARLDEMNATVTSLQSEADKLQADARKKVQASVAEMVKQRDAFSNAIKKQGTNTEDALAKAKTALESEWKAFESSLQRYFEEAREKTGQQSAVFRASAEAQRKTWQKGIDELRTAAAGLASEQKAQAETAVKRMTADADAAKAKLDALVHAGSRSWSAYSEALTASRAAFDSATQAAQKAFKRAA